MKKTRQDYKKYSSSGEEMHRLITELYPITRSITGDGVVETLQKVSKHIPLRIHQISSGTKAFDWIVPDEWNIKDAYVKNSKGERVIDFTKSNLHVVSYSIPVHKKMSLKELKKHLFTDPKNPDVIPYKTSYYEKKWGFCLSHNDLEKLQEDTYEVCIDASLIRGNLTYGELLIKGKTADEILISTHICHPSLCNDNLSGIAVAAFLGKILKEKKTRYSYRFLFIPGTIGSIAWLAKNEKHLKKIKGGFVLSGVGDSGNIHYKKSRRGNSIVDSAFVDVLDKKKKNGKILDFSPFGYDERQYCSPGIDLPIGCFMRSVFSTYPEYHTSADDLSFVKPAYLEDSLETCLSAIDRIEKEPVYISLNPMCEPQLGKRGLYKAMNDQSESHKKMQLALLWILNLSDGTNSLAAIAKRSKIEYSLLEKSAKLLLEHKLLMQIN